MPAGAPCSLGELDLTGAAQLPKSDECPLTPPSLRSDSRSVLCPCLGLTSWLSPTAKLTSFSPPKHPPTPGILNLLLLEIHRVAGRDRLAISPALFSFVPPLPRGKWSCFMQSSFTCISPNTLTSPGPVPLRCQLLIHLSPFQTNPSLSPRRTVMIKNIFLKQIRHGDVVYRTGNVINNIVIALYGVRQLLGLSW